MFRVELVNMSGTGRMLGRRLPTWAQSIFLSTCKQIYNCNHVHEQVIWALWNQQFWLPSHTVLFQIINIQNKIQISVQILKHDTA
jgi:hypothetical protein